MGSSDNFGELDRIKGLEKNMVVGYRHNKLHASLDHVNNWLVKVTSNSSNTAEEVDITYPTVFIDTTPEMTTHEPLDIGQTTMNNESPEPAYFNYEAATSEGSVAPINAESATTMDQVNVHPDIQAGTIYDRLEDLEAIRKNIDDIHSGQADSPNMSEVA